MDDRTVEGKRSLKEKSKDDFLLEDDLEDDVEEEEGGSGCFIDEEKKKLGAGVVSGKRGVGSSLPLCQVEMCGADLTDGKRYHRRHKVCEVHAKASAAMVAGITQRFCQQCSRFHELSEFDEAKRSCRRRLAGHNERRRKSLAETCGEGSSRKGFRPQLKEGQHRPIADRGSKYTTTLPGNTACRWPQIR